MITPTPELVDQWARDHVSLGEWMPFYVYIATRAAEWGYQQALETLEGDKLTLSPATQAVRHAAICAGPELEGRIAAALRAAAQTLAYEIHCPGEGWYELVVDANDLYAIAAELEGA